MLMRSHSNDRCWLQGDLNGPLCPRLLPSVKVYQRTNYRSAQCSISRQRLLCDMVSDARVLDCERPGRVGFGLSMGPDFDSDERQDVAKSACRG